jgi:flagellar operon protein
MGGLAQMNDPLRVQGEQSIHATHTDISEVRQNTKQQSDVSFNEILAQVQDVRFSNHAQKRLQSRQINLDADSVSRLADAVDRVEKRGSQTSLVLMDDLAFLVNVPERLVVTAVDTNNHGEGVFTQIDSVVLAEPSHLEDQPGVNIEA